MKRLIAFIACTLLLVAGGASYTFAAPKAAPAEDIKIVKVIDANFEYGHGLGGRCGRKIKGYFW